MAVRIVIRGLGLVGWPSGKGRWPSGSARIQSGSSKIGRGALKGRTGGIGPDSSRARCRRRSGFRNAQTLDPIRRLARTRKDGVSLLQAGAPARLAVAAASRRTAYTESIPAATGIGGLEAGRRDEIRQGRARGGRD